MLCLAVREQHQRRLQQQQREDDVDSAVVKDSNHEQLDVEDPPIKQQHTRDNGDDDADV